ncbi:STAS domain-containing protein [Rubritalea tangerina]|uniref:Anti-sigma factor antagonist n=2 Tax=Rubritalea tangerina TaxID=430798 RepID=A0ABW4Z9F5_9BACT
MGIVVKIKESRTNYIVLELFGKLDGQASEQFEKVIDEILNEKPKGITLTFDMASVDYISSMGIRLILLTRKKIEQHNGKLLLAHVQKPVLHVIELAKVLPSWSIFSGVKEADAYFDSIQNQVKESD